MLHFLLSVTDTLFTVAIVTGLLLGYAAQRDLLEVRAAVRRGTALGFATAAVLAGLEFTTAVVVREWYNLFVLCMALAAELTLWGLLAATRGLAPERAASPLLRAAFFAVLAALGAFYLPDMFIYPSHFAVGVVRVASSEFVFIVTGYALGLALALLAGYAAFRVSAVLPEMRLFPLFSLTFLAFVLTQAVNVGQILLGRGLLPRRDWALDAIIFLLNNIQVAVYLILGMTALIAVMLWRISGRTRIEGENPALRRKAQSLMRGRAHWGRFAILLLAAGLLTMTVGRYFDTLEVELSPPTEVTVQDGAIFHPTTVVGDGALHRFVYKSKKGANVRYIIIKKSGTAYGVGLDACDVCGPSGYYERKGQVICILCDVVMNKSTIGFAGGCNPVPLKFTLKDGSIVINTTDLEAEATRFM